MVRYEKNGVIMDIAEAMARVFEAEGYKRVTDVEAVTQPSVNAENHDETANVDEVKDKTTKKYNRSEIWRTNTADLKKIATSIGIEVTEESTGKALKEQICEKLGL